MSKEKKSVPNTQTAEDCIKSNIRDIPDFPKEGIIFKDITTVLNNPEAFQKSIDLLYEKFKDIDFDHIAGIESRGFLFGSALAYKLNKGFVPIRKPGKLPGKKEKISYELEYGSDSLEIHIDAFEKGQKILVIDDLLATGGTAGAAIKLVEKVGGKVIGCAFVVELIFLNGREKLPKDCRITSLITY